MLICSRAHPANSSEISAGITPEFWLEVHPENLAGIPSHILASLLSLIPSSIDVESLSGFPPDISLWIYPETAPG